MPEPRFTIRGDPSGASIEVEGMSNEQVASCLRHVLMTVYGQSGVEVSETDLVLTNIVMGELHDALHKTEKVNRTNQRLRLVLYLVVGFNVGAALFNVFMGMG